MCSIMCCCRAGADREEFSSLFGRSEERGPDDTKIIQVMAAQVSLGSQLQ